MTRGRGFKRLVRRRMLKTGESYTSVRAYLAPGTTHASTAGGIPMYPFERFTEPARSVLARAQADAHDDGYGHIGTEHLLLALLAEQKGLGGQVLAAMGVEEGAVQESIAAGLGPRPTVPVRQIVPTSRVKQVIEIAFEQAQRMGHRYVGTEHLLLGLLEGEGIAAVTLRDRGVTPAEARNRIEQALTAAEPGAPGAAAARRRSSAAGRQPGLPWSPDLVALMEAAEKEAEQTGATMLSLEHLVAALSRLGPQG
jgi:ATP-dependent Clp protease ATP-binding subunit ClpA